MGLTVVGEDVLHLGIHFLAVLCTGFFHHLDTSEGFDGAAQQLVSLQTYDQLVLFLDVAGLVGSDG